MYLLGLSNTWEVIINMTRLLRITLLASAVALATTAALAPSAMTRVAASEQAITFPDKALDKFIRDKIQKPAGQLYLSDVADLKTIHIENSGISDLDGIQYLTGLQMIYIEGGKVSKLPDFSASPNLVTIYLKSNPLKDIRNLKTAKALRYLYLYDTGVSGLNSIEGLPHLERLELSGNKIAKLPDLSTLPSLRSLSLARNKLTTLQGQGLEKLTNLHSLNLSGNAISNVRPLSGLTELTELILSDTKVSDVAPLASLTSLNSLYLDKSPIKNYAPLAPIYRNLTSKDFSMPLPKSAVSAQKSKVSAWKPTGGQVEVSDYAYLRQALNNHQEPIIGDSKMAQAYAKAKQIVSAALKPGMSDIEKIRALHDALVYNVKYDYDNFLADTVGEDSYTPYGALINGSAVCDGYSQAFDLLLQLSGFETLWIEGDVYNFSQWQGHSWNLVKLDGQYYHIDTTWDDPYNVDYSNYNYFLKTDAQMKNDHRWNYAAIPKATSNKWAFFRNLLNLPNTLEIGGWVYYRNYWDNYSLYRIKTDGTADTRLVDGRISEMATDGQWLYYSLFDGNSFWKIKMDGTGRKQLSTKQHSYSYLTVSGEWIYFTDIFDNGLYKMKKDATKLTRLGGTKVQAYSLLRVEGSWIYFMYNQTQYKIKTDGTGYQKVRVT